MAGQAGADRRQRRGDRGGIARSERAALEQAAGDRLAPAPRTRPPPAATAPSAISNARDCALAMAARSSARTLAAITGTITAAIAIDTTPSGNS